MASAGCLRRLEFALGALGLTVALGALVIALDAVRFHTTALAAAVAELRFGDIDPGGVALLGLAAAEGMVLLAAGRSVLKQLYGQHVFLRSLSTTGARRGDGNPLVLVADPRPLAFCAGLLRPRIYVSDATVRLLAEDELRAVVAHEAHHAARRDPLRLLVAGAFAAAFSPIPGLRSLRHRHGALAEIAADAAAVRSLGDARPLASALLAFDCSSSAAVVGISPERVDHLLGDASASDIPPWLLVTTSVVLAALALIVVRFALWPGHPTLPPAAPLCTLAALAIALIAPSWLASRRVTRTLRPAG